MNISERKSQKLRVEIEKWIKQISELNNKQNNLANEMFEQIALILSEDQNEKAEIATKIEDIIFDSAENETDLLSVVESIGGIEHQIVKVNPLLSEIEEEKNILEEIRVSTKNLVKSTLDIKKEMQEQAINEIEEIINRYKLKRDQITESIKNLNTKLYSNLKKIDFI